MRRRGAQVRIIPYVPVLPGRAVCLAMPISNPVPQIGPPADAAAVAAATETVPPTGLSTAAARALLAQQGPNELPQARRQSLVALVAEVLKEPMLALLLAGGLAYLLLGDLGEALVLLVFATFSVVVTIAQQARTQRVLDALRDLSAPRALVVRDGVRDRIAGRDVVVGDAMILVQGDRVAADATLHAAADLLVDESLLTGESVPVAKRACLSAEQGVPHRPGGDGQPFVYGGSLVVRGEGLAIVTATGARSEIGRIGASLSGIESEVPRLRAEMTRIVFLCAIGGGAVALMVVVLYGLLRGGWIDAVLAGIAIGMALLPEEFPVVLTTFLAMGAWRIGKAGVLTRRAAAIETLGSATVLCTDKTGTLTENRMRLVALWQPGGGADLAVDAPLPEVFRSLAETAVRASATDPADPMEVALHAACPARPGNDDRPVHGYGLRPDLLAMANVWRRPGGADGYAVAAKGAPEAIFDLCRLPAAERAAAVAAVEAMASRGIRVLGVCEADTGSTAWPETPRGFEFRFLGLVGLADPLRAGVPAAVAQCRAAGIRVVMITGDHAVTARAIARQAGIADGDVLTGDDLAGLDEAGLAARLASVTVFARIMPEQKLRIVSALKAAGAVVAMTGDGVNDAPSLKAAHIGIAMGKRGTDVAREASAIVLLDDDFGSIATAIALGRRIFDNIRKAMGFIFAVHVPIAGLALLPLLLGLPLLFGPVHVAVLEMVIDPVCALLYEAEGSEPDLMRRPPRASDELLLSWRRIGWSVAQGLIAFVAVAALYLGATAAGLPEGEVRALVFFSLVAAILALIEVNRTFGSRSAIWRPNPARRYVYAAVLVLCLIVLFVPWVQGVMRFQQLRPLDIAVAAGIGGLVLLALEGLRLVAGRSRAVRDRGLARA
jgi:Ca2+-transporting ATPase